MHEYTWRKPSRSGSSGDNCVEVAVNVIGLVAVRDSKQPDGAVLSVTPAQWRAFLGGLRSRS